MVKKWSVDDVEYAEMMTKGCGSLNGESWERGVKEETPGQW